MVLGPVLIHDPGDLDVGYIIPTVYVPLLLVAHFYAMKAMSQRSSEEAATFPRPVETANLPPAPSIKREKPRCSHSSSAPSRPSMACSLPLRRSCRHGRCSPAAHRVQSRQASW